jgi:hypothetical protein
MQQQLTDAERAWLEEDQALWERATEIALRHPDLDVGGLYHTLRNLQRTPEERLRRSLAHARLRRTQR